MKRIHTSKKGKAFFIIFSTFFLLLLAISSGCSNKFFDPTQIGRFRPTPAVNVILDTLGVAEEEQTGWEGAKEPRPEDTRLVETDYVFNPGDVIRISIFELYQEGFAVINEYVVTETGKISIADVGVIQAAGATEIQLEEEIRQILSPSILRNPSVTVALIGSQQRTFSILGDGVEIPGRYVIPRYDFRLTDALATARGPRQFNVSYIYVSRHARGTSLMDEPMKFEVIEPGFTAPDLTEPTFTLPRLTEPEITGIEEIRLPRLSEPEFIEPRMEDLIEPERELLEVITPLAQHEWPESKVVIASAELATERERTDMAWPDVVEPSRSRESQWKETESTEPSLGLTDSERTDKPVSIQDILKTLSSRARQERIDEQIDVDETPESYAEPITPETFEEPIDIEEALRSFGEPAAPEMPGIIEEPIDVKVDMLEPSFEPIVPEGIEEQGEEGRIEWIFQDGKWIPIQVGPPVQPEPRRVVEIEPRGAIEVPGELVVPGFEWAEQSPTRVIKIPADKLLAGDPRYNILIKPGDSIHVPVDIIGEFCIMGNVNRQGYINITGRPMTLKMAIAAAGGLDALAWPKRCEVVRRIGEDKEEIVMVDLDKIASGEQPDFFIKPNDLINVGTHPTSVWRAVLRNAFRATYGFGFIYDRNFAYADYNYGTTFMGIKQ